MFQLDLKSRKSIYEQVMDNLKELIMTGTLSAGEKLPSVRDLSKQITVNPNTVQKAYRELERQGYIYTTTGVGTFVADTSQIQADPRDLKAAREALDEAFRQLLYLGLTHEEAKEIAMTIIEERRQDYD
ncbi:MAG: GntR family transcriptional regulator [Firmicutes bacterium]|nr:GntR family transcriptional regulator [Bacillota bacterium]